MAKNTTYAEQSRLNDVKQKAHNAISDMHFAKIDDEPFEDISPATREEVVVKSENTSISKPVETTKQPSPVLVNPNTIETTISSEKKQGRPFLYDEKLKRVNMSFSFPEDIIKKIKKASALNGTNATQYILSCIKKDWEDNGDFYSKFPDIK